MTRVVSEPEVTLALIPSQGSVGLKQQRILVIGQRNGGTATSGQLVSDIQNDNSWDSLFGADSQIAGMCRNVRKVNTETSLDAISLSDNGSGVAAAGQVSFTGTSTAAGVIAVSIGSESDFTFEIPVAEGATDASLATLLADAVNASTSAPFDAAASTADVDLTAVNAGTVGNSFAIKIEGQVDGITVASTAFTGGSIDPDFTNLFDVIEDRRYQTIIWPYFDDIETIKDFLDSRFNVQDNVLDGVAHVGVDDTFANLLALGNANNSQSIVINGDELISRDKLKGGSIVEIPYAKSAQIGGIDALRLTDGALISRYVIGRGSKDRFGGIALASLPYFNTPLPFLPLMDVQDGFTRQEVENLQDAGVSTIGNNRTNTDVLMGEMLTTYKTDAASNEDITWKFLNYVRTSSNIREYFFNNLKARFAQTRLTEGSLIPGYDMANKAVIEAYVGSLYQELANVVLVQDGEAALQFFKENLTVELDLSTGSVFISMVTPIVTQLRAILGTIRIEFTTEG